MAGNKTKPTTVNVNEFLNSVSDIRRHEAAMLIDMMVEITQQQPTMWGPSIIGFGSKHFKYDTGREGDIPQLGFSPRKAAMTIYFNEGFDRYGQLLPKLGKYKTSVSCLYIKKLDDIDLQVLHQMLDKSFQSSKEIADKPATVEEYIARMPAVARPTFDELRSIVKAYLPNAEEVFSYGIIGYKIDDKRARVYISGWKDHVAIYPVPKDPGLAQQLKPYMKGKGTIWFPLDKELPQDLIRNIIKSHTN